MFTNQRDEGIKRSMLSNRKYIYFLHVPLFIYMMYSFLHNYDPLINA